MSPWAVAGICWGAAAAAASLLLGVIVRLADDALHTDVAERPPGSAWDDEFRVIVAREFGEVLR